MRFSAIFQAPALPPREVAPAPEVVRVQPQEAAAALPATADRKAAAAELPDDLDARVRLVGEWQLGECD